jgi:type II secretory pathway predicted ATPase ExeA
MMEEQKTRIEAYCTALGWDASRLRSAFHASGLPHAELYLTEPVRPVLDRIDEFFETEFGILVVTGPNGLGKSALRDFVLQGLKQDTEYATMSVNNPGLCSTRHLAVTIFELVHPESKPPRTQGATFTALMRDLVARRDSGVTTVLWIDEGQRLKIGHIELLRALSDTKSAAGDTACKIIISGTDGLKKHIEEWLVSDPEEASAFCDRWGTFAVELQPWTATHTRRWTTQLAKFAAATNRVLDPFEPAAIAAICTHNEGRPRPIVQTVRAAILRQAEIYASDNTKRQINAVDVGGLFN